MVSAIILAGLYTLPCQVLALRILYRHARMSVRSQLEPECQKEVNNKHNIDTKSIIDNDSKALIIDVRSGRGVNFLVILLMLLKILDDDKYYHHNWRVSSAVLSASLLPGVAYPQVGMEEMVTRYVGYLVI
jgi:hypothetical protein